MKRRTSLVSCESATAEFANQTLSATEWTSLTARFLALRVLKPGCTLRHAQDSKSVKVLSVCLTSYKCIRAERNADNVLNCLYLFGLLQTSRSNLYPRAMLPHFQQKIKVQTVWV